MSPVHVRVIPAAALFLLAPVPSGFAQSTLFTFDGDSFGDNLGISVSQAGDVNGDGFDDVITGSFFDDNNGLNSGSVRVFSGADGTILYTFDGDSGADFLGLSVSGAGDVNGDGYADLIAGASGDDDNGTNSGSARVYSGADGSVLHTFVGDSADDQFGNSVSGAGDVNADGYDDLIVGALFDDDNGSSSGSARVFSGVNGSVLYTFHGDSASDRFGSSVSGAGDVNADGYDDLVVGAPEDDNNGPSSGSARVFSGLDGSVIATHDGDSIDDAFGQSVSGAGDVNADGYDDLIVGSPEDSSHGTWSGRARVISGRNGDSLHTFDGDSEQVQFGWSVSGAGDVNGDGYADLVVGAPHDGEGDLFQGSARVFSGLDGSILATFYGDSNDDLFGRAVSGAGDLNADGYADLIVGAPLDDNNGSGSGSARVFSMVPAVGNGSCFGFPCPCANDDFSAGCANSTGSGGLLSGIGSSSVTTDNLHLRASNLPRTQCGLFYMGDEQVFHVLYDGLQCALGTTFRFLDQIQVSTASGTMTLVHPVADSGSLITAGSTWYFHCWYRDVPDSPCGTGANLTNLYGVTFTR